MSDRLDHDTPAQLLQIVHEAFAAGLSIVPPMEDGSKRPKGDGAGRWKAYQTERADRIQIEQWYGPCTGWGVLTGSISGNLECLDIDSSEAFIEFQALMEASGLGPLLDRVSDGWSEITPGEGVHIYWRCPTIAGNTKLAQAIDRTTLIETRGEGGYVIGGWSHGGVHESGGTYELVSGGPSTVRTITPAERESIFQAARALNQVEPKRADADRTPVAIPGAVARPGDDFNARADIEDELQRRGWTLVYVKGNDAFYRRPGKDRGVSAVYHRDTGIFVNFSTSTPFETERGYGKFSVYAILNHDGDFKRAASALASSGFGAPIQPSHANPIAELATTGALGRRLLIRPLDTIEERPVDWLWPGWIPFGMLTILAGYPGDGKSTILAALAAALSRSGSVYGALPDLSPAPAVRTLILAAEDIPEVTIKPRFSAHKGDGSKVLIVDGTADANGQRGWIHLKDDIEMIREAVVQHGVKLVVIDPLSSYMSGANRNQEGDIRDALQPLVQFAEETGAAVVGVAHIGKSVAGIRAAQRVMGATAWIALARVVIMVDTLPSEHQIEATNDNPEPAKRKVIEVVKSNISKEPPPLMFAIEDRVKWLGRSPMRIQEIIDAARAGDDGESKRDRAVDWLKDFLADGEKPQKEVEQAASNNGIKGATLQRAKKQAGIVSRRDGGSAGLWLWSLPTMPDNFGDHLTKQTNSKDDHGDHLTKQTTFKDAHVSIFENTPKSPQFWPNDDQAPGLNVMKGSKDDHLNVSGDFDHLYSESGAAKPESSVSDLFCVEPGCNRPVAPGNNYRCEFHARGGRAA